LILFYSSIILAHLVAINKKSIDTFVDLSNSDLIITITKSSSTALMIEVIFILKYYQTFER